MEELQVGAAGDVAYVDALPMGTTPRRDRGPIGRCHSTYSGSRHVPDTRARIAGKEAPFEVEVQKILKRRAVIGSSYR